jgi:hypothetical protein
MHSQKLRKSFKVFKRISRLVQTRNSTQVKSHHQKLENKYRNISGIIFNLESYLKRYYETKYKKYLTPVSNTQ